MPPADVRLTEVLPGSPEGRAVLRDYFRDIVSRSRAREATDGEVDAEMRDDPSDDLCPPGGLLLVASRGTTVIGCVGLHLRGRFFRLPDSHCRDGSRWNPGGFLPLAFFGGIGTRLLLFVCDSFRRQFAVPRTSIACNAAIH